MNPVTPRTPQPGRPIQDVAPPNPNPADTATLTTTIVQNIPIRTQTGPANEDAELDKIIQDVGDLKKAAAKPKKHGFFSKKPKAPAPDKPAAAAQPADQPASAAQPSPNPADKSSAPVFVIFMTIVVTSALIAAAVYAYQ